MFFEGIRSERKLIETASPQPGPSLVPRLRPGRVAARPLQPDPHPAAPRRRHLPALLRAGRRSVPGGRAGLGQGALLRRHQGRGQCRPDSLVPRFYHEAKATSPTCSLTTGASRRGHAEGTAPTRPPRPPAPARVERPTERPPAGADTAAGGCWRSGGWIRTGRRSAATNARATCASVPTDPDATPDADGTARAWATTTTTSSTVASPASSWRCWSPRPT